MGFPLRLFLFLVGEDDFERPDIVRLVLPEPLAIDVRDEDSQWSLPRFLSVIGETAELLWVQTKLPCHLNMRVRQVVPFPRVNPRLIL